MVIKEFKTQMVTFITAAFGFVAALLWKDAISAWLAPLYETAEGAVGLTIAATAVSVIAVFAIIVIVKITGNKKKKRRKK